MVSPAQQADVVRFGPFELDLRTCWLTRQGHQERLALQPSRLLALLVQRPGELVTREELRARLWPEETFVDFDHGLNNAVNRVREALRDSASSPIYLQTIPRRGYRFIAEVETVSLAEPVASSVAQSPIELDEPSAAIGPEVLPNGPQPAEVAQRAVFRPRLLLVLTMATAGFLAIAGFLFRGRAHPNEPIRSLAVLPLQNLSGDAGEDYFADGITDALTTELAHAGSLRVVSRTSAMREGGNGKSLRQIAAELDVDAVVEGSVARSGGRVRVTARLIDTRGDRNLWAASFVEPLGDVLSLEDRMAREIATQTQAALAPQLLSAAPRRVDPAAYDAYLRGRYFFHLRDAPKALSYFRQAIALDPSYAAAYAGLADALTSERVLSNVQPRDTESQAVAAARRAIELDTGGGEAYAALGFAEIVYYRDWFAAGRDLEKGLALKANDSVAELQYAVYLDAVGRTDDAVAHMRHALKIDPLSFVVNRHLGSVLYLNRQYKEALVYMERAAEMEPSNFRLVENWRSRTYEALGQYDRAEQSDLLILGAWFSEKAVAPLREAYRRGGWKAYQTARIALLATRPDLACFPYETGESYLRLGDRDQAFLWIGRGVDTSCFWYNSLAVNPLLDGLRSDPRYPALLTRVHLPESNLGVKDRR